jgi:hypothetical protein
MISANKPAQLYCPTHNTRKEPLSSICLESGCLSKGLLCSHCIVQSHSKHMNDVLSLDQLAEDLQNCSFDKSVNVILQQCMQRIKDTRTKLLTDIARTRQHIAKALDETQQWLTSVFDKAEEMITEQTTALAEDVPKGMEVDMSQPLESVNKRVKEMVETLKQYRRKVTETVKAGEDTSTEAQRRAKEAAEALTEVSETVTQRLAKLLQLSVNMQSKEDMLSSVQNQFNSVTGIVWESAFSTEFKHADITINDTVAILEKGKRVCAMGATALDASAPGRINRCRVRIGTLNRFMCLGVASQNTIRDNNFKPLNGAKLGHGEYTNGSNGNTYSHSDVTINFKPGTLTFKEDDSVEMEFDAMALVLHLRCNGQQSSLTVIAPQKDDCYRFVV